MEGAGAPTCFPDSRRTLGKPVDKVDFGMDVLCVASPSICIRPLSAATSILDPARRQVAMRPLPPVLSPTTGHH